MRVAAFVSAPPYRAIEPDVYRVKLYGSILFVFSPVNPASMPKYVFMNPAY